MERRGAQARPRLFSFLGHFLLAVFGRQGDSFLPLSILCLSLLLAVWETHYDRLGRSGCKR